MLTLAASPLASAWPKELWTITPVGRSDGGRAIVAERVEPQGREAFTLEESRGTVLAVPAIALGDGGRAAAAWVREGAAGSELAGALFDGRAWGQPVRIAASARYLGQPALAAGAGDSWWLAAVRDIGSGDDVILFRWHGGEASEFRTFGKPGAPDIEPRLSRGADGEVRLSWRAFDGGSYRRQHERVEGGGGAAGAGSATDGRAEDAVPPALTPAASRGGVAWADGERFLSAPLVDQPSEPGMDAPPGTAAGGAAGAADLSRILGLGDSTTWGRGSIYGGPPTDYLTRLENRLRGPWTVHNGGHPGYTSADLLSVADGELARRPGLTLLMIGINDAFERYSYDTVSVNVRALVDKARAAGSAVVLATTTPVIDSGPRADQHRHLAQVVNPAIRAVAAAAKVSLVDVWSYFASLSDWRTYIYLPHGNHLTGAGYELVASRFLGVLQKNDLQLPAGGSARGPLLADVSLGIWDLPIPGVRTQAGNAGAELLLRDTVSPLADNGIVAATPLDLDGDGIDGVAVVRARAGAVSLTVYAAPAAGTADPAALRASVTVQAEADWLPRVCTCADGQVQARRSLTHLFAVDQDGDGRDEFGIVCSRTCVSPAGIPSERQVVEIWRAHQPGGGLPERVVKDEWLLPGGGRIHDVAAVQADDDGPQEILLLVQNQRVDGLHTLSDGNPDAIRLLASGRYGRVFDCGQDAVPAGWRICDRWINSGKSVCGQLELRTLTPRVLIYDAPPAGASTRAGNNEPLLLAWSHTGSPEIAVRCVDTGQEWVERTSDVLGVAAADIDRPADGRDEVLVLRLRAADVLEAWSLPAAAGAGPELVALDRWVRTDPSGQYLLKAGSIPDGAGGVRRGVFLWLNRRN